MSRPLPSAIEQPADLTLLRNQQAIDKKLEDLNSYTRRQIRLLSKQVKELQAELAKIKAGPDDDGYDQPGEQDDDDDGTEGNPLVELKRVDNPPRRPRGRK